MLWMFQRGVWGEITNPKNEALADMNGRERLMLAPLLVLIVWMGMLSSQFLRPMDNAVARIVDRVEVQPVPVRSVLGKPQ
jgi:NADH-quinone oxidoreductase subunit M